MSNGVTPQFFLTFISQQQQQFCVAMAQYEPLIYQFLWKLSSL